MSIQSEIDRINDNISDAYSVIDEMGGTLPAAQNSANLASAIGSIPAGGGVKSYYTQFSASDWVPLAASVSITGSGNSTYCYATIGGTKRYGAGTYQVTPGSTIVFSVYGRSATYKGTVTINGETELEVTNQSTQTYTWTVPNDVTQITIAMSYTSTSSSRRGNITVTTFGGGGGTIDIPASEHELDATVVMAQFFGQVGGTCYPNTWSAMESYATVDAQTGAITLHSDSAYAGAVLLIG